MLMVSRPTYRDYIEMCGRGYIFSMYAMNAKHCKFRFSLESHFSVFPLYFTNNVFSDVGGEVHPKFLQCGHAAPHRNVCGRGRSSDAHQKCLMTFSPVYEIEKI